MTTIRERSIGCRKHCLRKVEIIQLFRGIFSLSNQNSELIFDAKKFSSWHFIRLEETFVIHNDVFISVSLL